MIEKDGCLGDAFFANVGYQDPDARGAHGAHAGGAATDVVYMARGAW